MKRLPGLLAIAMCSFAGCTSDGGVDVDGRDDSFTAEGKLDGFQCTAAEAAAIVKVANPATPRALTNDVQLGPAAGDNILAFRAGDDEQAGTSDDGEFGSLAELDAVPFIGPTAFGKLLDYVRAADLVDEPTAAGEWFSETVANGYNYDMTVAPNGSPVVVYADNTAGYVRMPGGNTITLPTGVRAAQVAVDGTGTVHVFYKPTYNVNSWNHASWNGAEWKQHDVIAANRLQVDQGANGEIFALIEYPSASNSERASYQLATVAANGTTTVESLWGAYDEMHLNVDRDGFANVMWTDMTVRTGRRTAAGWQTRTTGYSDWHPYLYATTGGASPTAFLKKYEYGGVGDFVTLRGVGSSFVEMPPMHFGVTYNATDATLDAQGNAHACVAAGGDVAHVRIDAAGTVTRTIVGAGEKCWLGTDKAGTLHLMYAQGSVINHATYQ